MFKIIYRFYRERFYDELVQEFIGVVPNVDREPVIEWLADKKVLFERFLSIQAYHIQRARIGGKKSPDFYDGALMIIKAFLAAVNRKVISRVDKISLANTKEEETKKELEAVTGFLKKGKKLVK